jgi:hypothetical protein
MPLGPGSEIFPLGATLDSGEWRIVERLRGTADRGVFRAHRRDGKTGLVTLGGKQARSWFETGARLEVQAPGVAPIAFVGPLEHGGEERFDALVELEPAGAPLSSLPLPLAEQAAIRLGLDLARIVAHAHDGEAVLGGLRPETIYCAAGGAVAGVAPHGEPFLATAAPPSYGIVPLYDHLYAAPEVLMGHDATAASDVFSLCAVLAFAASGEPPFEGDSAREQLFAITSNHRRALRAPRSLQRICDAGLAPAPPRRPTARAIEAQLLPLLPAEDG